MKDECLVMCENRYDDIEYVEVSGLLGDLKLFKSPNIDEVAI